MILFAFALHVLMGGNISESREKWKRYRMFNEHMHNALLVFFDQNKTKAFDFRKKIGKEISKEFLKSL